MHTVTYVTQQPGIHTFQAYRGTEMEQVLWKKGFVSLQKSTKYFMTSFALFPHES